MPGEQRDSVGEPSPQPQPERTKHMLSWAITFLVIALIAGLLGFTTIAGTAIGFAKIVFVVFLILFIISFVMGRGAPRT